MILKSRDCFRAFFENMECPRILGLLKKTTFIAGRYRLPWPLLEPQLFFSPQFQFCTHFFSLLLRASWFIPGHWSRVPDNLRVRKHGQNNGARTSRNSTPFIISFPIPSRFNDLHIFKLAFNYTLPTPAAQPPKD